MSIHPFTLAGSGGRPVRGDLWLPDHAADASPVVIGVHGFKGLRRWGFWPPIATQMNAAGFAFVGFDMSHNGVGAGGLEFDEPDLFEKNTWAREEEDLATLLAALRGGRLPEPHRVDVHRLALMGHSRGGGLAIVHAERDVGVAATVALAPVSTVLRFEEPTLARGRRMGFIPILNTRTNETMRFGAAAIAELTLRTDLHDIAANYAARLASPLLVVHGEDDSAVPVAEGRALAAAAPRGTFLGIPGADHVLGCRHPWAGPTAAFEQFIGAARTFLRRSLT